jgi:hypothetical protein
MHYCSPSLRHHECVQLRRDYYSIRALSFTEVFGGRTVHLTASAGARRGSLGQETVVSTLTT